MIMTKKRRRAIDISFIITHNTTYIHITYTSYYFIKSRPSLFISSVPTVFTNHVYLGCAITVLDLHYIFYSCVAWTVLLSLSLLSHNMSFFLLGCRKLTLLMMSVKISLLCAFLAPILIPLLVLGREMQ